ncbi:MAG: Imm27 family immunity protein [Verrucomicrobiota bacterium]
MLSGIMRLLPEEHELYGFTAAGQWDSATQSRIQQLVSQHLQRVGTADGGWSVLFRDPMDGRYWELTYPRSEMHGGGPARLAEIAQQQAMQRYVITTSNT